MTALETLLNTYREASKAEREKGTYFEDLIIAYFRNEASYKDLYSQVWTYSDWAGYRHRFSCQDTRHRRNSRDSVQVLCARASRHEG